jgi:arylsulfatase A-like enzyme
MISESRVMSIHSFALIPLPISSLKHLAVILCVLGVLCGASARAAEKPNFIVILADDLGYGDLACYGAKDIATPHIDQMAREGAKFTSCYVAPVCSPTRASLMTGCIAQRVGIGGVLFPRNDHGLNPDERTLPELLKAQGYATAIIGKWHLGNQDMFQPLKHGFDYWFGTPSSNSQEFDPTLKQFAPDCVWREGYTRESILKLKEAPCPLVRNNVVIEVPAHQSQFTQRYTREAIRFITENKDKPFFLYGSFNPHMPWYVPKKYFDMYPLDQIVLPELKAGDLDDLPPMARAVSDGVGGFADKVIKSGKHKEAVQAYLATTTYVDTQMGRVLDALENSPYKDNTIVVFLTDHGLHLGEKLHWQKTTLWEEGTHTLLMFRAPGVTQAGGVSERFVSLLDIYPTLAELCGLTPPAYLDGRSLVPLLKDPKAPWESTAMTGLCTKGKQEGESFISIWHELGRYTRYGAKEEEFYDTTQDAHEWTNQIANPDYASTVIKLRALVPSFETAAKPLPSALTPERRETQKSKKEKKRDKKKMESPK